MRKPKQYKIFNDSVYKVTAEHWPFRNEKYPFCINVRHIDEDDLVSAIVMSRKELQAFVDKLQDFLDDHQEAVVIPK